MTDFKLKCYSCEFERFIGEREIIEDIQQCPKCGSENIEIIAIEGSELIKEISPEVREQMAKHRMLVIGIVGILFLLGAFISYLLSSFMPLFGFGVITLLVIGVILLIIVCFWFYT
jgi:ABC-type uncharacterized transport system fused permease/ATPase subunit